MANIYMATTINKHPTFWQDNGLHGECQIGIVRIIHYIAWGDLKVPNLSNWSRREILIVQLVTCNNNYCTLIAEVSSGLASANFVVSRSTLPCRFSRGSETQRTGLFWRHIDEHIVTYEFIHTI